MEEENREGAAEPGSLKMAVKQNWW